MPGIVTDFLEGLLDLVYPPKCVVCDDINPHYICSSCIERIQPVEKPYCHRCGHTMLGVSCRDCSERGHSFTYARALGSYEGVLREAIHRFKYSGYRVLAKPLGDLLYHYLENEADFKWKVAEVIIPVPVHRSRLRLRGYNQSELLAERMSELTSLPLVRDSLIRIVATKPQVECSPEERRTNLKGAFAVRSPEAISGKVVLLIDDVGTTCSTAHECSTALLRAGAARVYVLCLAFGT